VSPSADPGSSFLEELKRRKVVRAALLYIASAFAVLQGADLVLPIYDAPDWAMRLLFGLALAGLPVVLVLAWVLDLRRDGGWFRRDSGPAVDPDSAAGNRWLSPATLALTAILVLTAVAAGLTLRGLRGNPGSASIVDAALDSRAVAVLPFANRSGLDDDRYFIDGIHDDILTQLHRIGALRVISRTSVQEYRDRSLGMAEVGRQLGVGSILEGGVQRSGDQVRINLQLIDVSTGVEKHVWADTYDRRITATNLFEVQSQIAMAVASALSARLQPAELAHLARQPTASSEAYDAYLHGLAAFHRYELSPADPGWMEAAVSLRRAVAFDPSFAEAWSRLGLALVHFGSGSPAPALRAEALHAAEQARSLAPTLPGADHVQALLAFWEGNSKLHLEAARRAYALAPDQPEIIRALGEALDFYGVSAEAAPLWLRSVALDPRSAQMAYLHGRSAAFRGDLELARAEFRRSLALAHGTDALTWVLPLYVPVVHAADGYDAALAIVRGALDRISVRGLQLVLQGDPAFAADDVVYDRVLTLPASDVVPGFHDWAEGWRARLQGRDSDARAAFARSAAARAAPATPLSATAAARLAQQYALAGQTAAARRPLEDAIAEVRRESLAPWRRQDLWREIAAAHAALGNAPAAAAAITEARSISMREVGHLHLAALPQWEPVRTSPAFRALVRPDAR
jgi:TolB-like protein